MNKYHGVEIAIIGMAGQFPGADDVDEFWKNLKHGKESISFFTDEMLLEEGESRERLNNPRYVKANAYIRNKEFFDSNFFGYLPAEAKLMDPQLRLFHENCWSAMEDAGYDLSKNGEIIGLFAGGSPNNNWVNYSTIANAGDIVDGFTTSHLNDVTFLCSRISYLLNLQGPSEFINTACSTSLVAVQRACMSLLLRECSMAIAGGITLRNYSKKGYLYQEGMINSTDGHCRAFDKNASGTVGGEGVGVVVLKRLDDAIRDRDNIHAIIRGSAVNNDGHDKMSFTAPSVTGQYKAIRKSMHMAHVEPESISYVETHGTGTVLGDAVEIEALNLAFGKSEEKYCALGSVKSNIGHLDAAAGIAGLIKTVLALKNRQIPPSLHFIVPNPEINFKDTPFYVNTMLREWKKEYPLRAGVSSFGIGGTNAHLILEEAPKGMHSSESRDYQLLVFSAKTPTALERNIDNFRTYLRENVDTNLSDTAYTLQMGRAPFPYRKMVVCRNKEEALEQLFSESHTKIGIAGSKQVKPLIVFMFPGQGSQYVNMASDLFKNESIFRDHLNICFDVIKKISHKDLKSILFPVAESKLNNDIDNTEFAQPALFCIEYALAQLLIRWGVKPSVMIGHSIGEYVAACISGVFSLEDVLSLVIKRGKLMQKTAGGKMLSIAISENKLKTLLENHPDISLAAVNSSELCVVSGEEESIKRFCHRIEKDGYACKTLRTSHAFHSNMMEEILDEFHEEVCSVKINSQQIPFLSNLSGNPADDRKISKPQYWSDHLRKTVMFSRGIESLLKNDHAIFIEVGPGNALSTFVRSNFLRKKEHKVINLLRHAQDRTNDLQYLLDGIGELWLAGLELDWTNFYEKENRRKISLPSYSFDRIKYPVIVDSFKIIAGMISSANGTHDTTSLNDIANDITFDKALPVPKMETANEYVPPGTELESTLVKIWEEFLGIEKIGIHDNFYGLGGHSLLAMRLVSAIKKEINIEVPLKSLLQLDTIKLISQWIETNQNNNTGIIENFEEIKL